MSATLTLQHLEMKKIKDLLIKMKKKQFDTFDRNEYLNDFLTMPSNWDLILNKIYLDDSQKQFAKQKKEPDKFININTNTNHHP
jgi:hypothetical protein